MEIGKIDVQVESKATGLKGECIFHYDRKDLEDLASKGWVLDIGLANQQAERGLKVYLLPKNSDTDDRVKMVKALVVEENNGLGE